MIHSPPGRMVSRDLARTLLGEALSRQDIADFVAEAGIDARLIESPGARVPAEGFRRLWERMEAAAGDPNFGLHLGELRQPPSGHVVLAAMLNSATVRQALTRFCRYHDLMAD